MKMESDFEIIHQLVISYLEGTITSEDEIVLFDFMTLNKENRLLFKQWEAQWKASHIPSNEEVKMLDNIETRVHTRSMERSLSSLNRKLTLHKIWQGLAVAASLFLVCLATVKITGAQYKKEKGNPFVIETQNAEQSKVHLPDGTVVWLNSATTLTCSNLFNETNRTVILSGEAYFEVSKNEELPFMVQAKGCSMTVKGTKFSVTAYREDPTVTTALMEGALDFKDGSSVIPMSPDDVIRYEVATKTVYEYGGNAQQYMSWTEGRIEYDYITFDELFDRLVRHYDVNITFTSENKMNKIFNISLNNEETAKDVLDALSLIVPINVRNSGRDFFISIK